MTLLGLSQAADEGDQHPQVLRVEGQGRPGKLVHRRDAAAPRRQGRRARYNSDVAPIPLNQELIRSRAADIRAEMDRLRAYARLSQEAFAAEAEKVRAARYGLIVVVEAAAAICNHLCARLGRTPDSYPGCFATLGELRIVDADLAGRLAALARLRNLLVHGYARVDDRRLHRLLEEGLGDLETFLAAVGEYVRRESEDRG